MTTVISVRGRSKAELLADPNFVYVGRRCAGWPASIWGNPFKVGMTTQGARRVFESIGSKWLGTDRLRPIGSGEAVEFFQEWITAQPDLMARLPELKSRRLGCWCGNWQPGDPEIECHAVVLARLADAAEGVGT